MPPSRLDNPLTARWLSNPLVICQLGVLCLLGLPGIGSNSLDPDERPNSDLPVESSSEQNSQSEEDQKGINPHYVLSAAKHDQLIPRRAATQDERPIVRLWSTRDPGELTPEHAGLDSATLPALEPLLRTQTLQFALNSARAALNPSRELPRLFTDPAVGSCVHSSAPPAI